MASVLRYRFDILTSVCKAAYGCAPQFAVVLAHSGAVLACMGKSFYIHSVADAASIAGGYDRLASALGVSTDEVESWSAGIAIPECAVFLRLIEIVLNPRLLTAK